MLLSNYLVGKLLGVHTYKWLTYARASYTQLGVDVDRLAVPRRVWCTRLVRPGILYESAAASLDVGKVKLVIDSPNLGPPRAGRVVRYGAGLPSGGRRMPPAVPQNAIIIDESNMLFIIEIWASVRIRHGGGRMR
jgi:hypothetical protein